MTDFSKTLEGYERIGAEKILAQLSTQQQEIKEKIHLISVLSAVEELKKLVTSKPSGFFEPDIIRVQYSWDREGCYLDTDVFDDKWNTCNEISRQIYICLHLTLNDKSFFASAYKKNKRIDFKRTEQGVEDLKNNDANMV